jgi:hypothetical protein
MDKNAILVLDFGEKRRNIDLCVRSIDLYADSIGVDFVHKTHLTCDNEPRYDKIFSMIDLLDKYDRVLMVDRDILIKKDTVDFFQKYNDYDTLYATRNYFRGKGYERDRQYQDVMKYEELYCQKENINWSKDEKGYIYFSTGVILLSKHHKQFLVDLLENRKSYQLPDRSYSYTQPEFNFFLQKYKIKSGEIPYKDHSWYATDEKGVQITSMSHFWAGYHSRQNLIYFYDKYAEPLQDKTKRYCDISGISYSNIFNLLEKLGLGINKRFGCIIGNSKNKINAKSYDVFSDYDDYFNNCKEVDSYEDKYNWVYSETSFNIGDKFINCIDGAVIFWSVGNEFDYSIVVNGVLVK